MATTLSALVMKIGMDASEVEAGSAQVRSDVSRVNNVFREMQTESDKLIAKAEALTRQFKRGKVDPEKYAETMAFLEAKFKALQDEADGTSDALKKQEAVVKRLMTAIETPLDRIKSDFNELNKALESGTVDAEDHAKMVEYLTQQYMDATGQTKKFADENTSDMRRVASIISKAETETEKLNAEFNALNRLYRRGKIGAEEYARGVENLNERHKRLHEEANKTSNVIGDFAKRIVPTVNLVDVFRLGIDAGRAALDAFASAAATVRDKMAELDPIIKQSRAMGELTANVQTLAFALSESAGMSIEETSQSLMELQKRLGEAQLGTGEAANALKILGLNAAEVARLSPVEQFRLVANELQKVEDATMRAYLADKLFAEQGKKLVNGLTQSNQALAEAEQAARNFGLAISDIQATGIEAANDALGRVSAQIDGIITQFSAELAPAIAFLATELSRTLPLGATLSHTFKEISETVVATYAVLGDWANILTGVVLVKQGEIAEGFRLIKTGIDGTFSEEALQRYDAMKRQIAKSAQMATQMRAEAQATAAPVQQVADEYEKQFAALQDQLDALRGIDVERRKIEESRKDMTDAEREQLTNLEYELSLQRQVLDAAKQQEELERKRLEILGGTQKRAEEIAASMRRGTADRPGLIEAGTQAAADVAMQGVFDKQEEQLRLLEEQKLITMLK